MSEGVREPEGVEAPAEASPGDATRPRYAIHVILFLTTLVTTTISIGLWSGLGWVASRLGPDLEKALEEGGSIWTLMWEGFNDGSLPFARFCEAVLVDGGMYSSTLLTILLAHEMGHYVLGRIHKVDVSLPYFIPAPPLVSFGTFGAFIRLREPVTDRRALMDIGAAGPLAGLVLAIPAIALGLSLSEVRPLEPGGLYEGNSLLYLGLKWAVLGDIPPGSDVFLHPIAFAGWVGLLVTALNLFPVGQLDGGHIMYALLGERSAGVNRAVFGSLLGLGIGLFLFKGQATWAVWIVLLLLIGIEHPPMSDMAVPLDRARRWIGWLCVAVFIVTFTPIPLSDEPPGGVPEQAGEANPAEGVAPPVGEEARGADTLP